MIKLNNISKSYDGRTILKKINLQFHKNQMTFIVGTSGAGKSTMLNVIGGLDRPDCGDVVFEGQNILLDLDSYRANHVGFVFQDYNLIAGLNLNTNLKLGTLFSRRNVSDAKIEKSLDLYGLSHLEQDVGKLSGGEKQRTAIARAVIKDADVIIADEPSGNLDSANTEIVFEEFRKLKENKYIIIVTHDMDIANRFADRIITISDGNIVSDSLMKESECAVKEKEKDDRISKKSNFFKPILILGNNSIKRRLARMLSIALVLGLAISSLAMVWKFNLLGQNVANATNKYYLETDLISIYYENAHHAPIMSQTFTDDAIAEIKNQFGSNLVEAYSQEENKYLFTSASKTGQSKIKQINIDDSFKTRVMSNDIIGRFIQDPGEIILAEDVAAQLFGAVSEEILERFVNLNDGNGQSLELKIVGINRTLNPENEIYSFVAGDAMKVLKSLSLKQKQTEMLSFDVYREGNGVSGGGLKACINSIKNEESLLYGRLPKDENEILLSHSQLNFAFTSFGMKNNFTDEDILGGKVDNNVLQTLYSNKLTFVFDTFRIVNIVGIFESDEFEMWVTENALTSMLEPKPNVLELYVDNIDESEKTVAEINNFEGLNAVSNYKNFIENVSHQTRFFNFALMALGLILILIAVFMIISFSKLNITDRLKEIAIVQSLGATSFQVRLTLLYDVVIINLIALVVAMLVSIAWVVAFPILLPALSFAEMSYPLLSLLAVSGVFIAFTMIYYVLYLRKTLKKQPADLLRA